MSAVMSKSPSDVRLHPDLVLLEDTRNQIGQHDNIHRYCEQANVKIVRSKLYVGDYQIANQGGICVDTKASVGELASNCFQEHERFRRELIRAQESGIQLIVLTEESLPGGRLDQWRSPLDGSGCPRYRFDPAVLRKALITMQERYGVRFRFCDGRSTGKTLIAYLKGELR